MTSDNRVTRDTEAAPDAATMAEVAETAPSCGHFLRWGEKLGGGGESTLTGYLSARNIC